MIATADLRLEERARSRTFAWSRRLDSECTDAAERCCTEDVLFWLEASRTAREVIAPGAGRSIRPTATAARGALTAGGAKGP